jgi:hypothetical protein
MAAQTAMVVRLLRRHVIASMPPQEENFLHYLTVHQGPTQLKQKRHAGRIRHAIASFGTA